MVTQKEAVAEVRAYLDARGIPHAQITPRACGLLWAEYSQAEWAAVAEGVWAGMPLLDAFACVDAR